MAWLLNKCVSTRRGPPRSGGPTRRHTPGALHHITKLGAVPDAIPGPYRYLSRWAPSLRQGLHQALESLAAAEACGLDLPCACLRERRSLTRALSRAVIGFTHSQCSAVQVATCSASTTQASWPRGGLLLSALVWLHNVASAAFCGPSKIRLNNSMAQYRPAALGRLRYGCRSVHTRAPAYANEDLVV